MVGFWLNQTSRVLTEARVIRVSLVGRWGTGSLSGDQIYGWGMIAKMT